MIDGLAGVRHVLADELGTHAAAATDAELLDDFAHVEGAIALIDEELGIAVADILALHLAGFLAGFLYDVNFGATLGCGQGALDACMTAAQHENLGVHRGDDLVIGDLRCGAQPIDSAAVAIDAVACRAGSPKCGGLAFGLRLGRAPHEAARAGQRAGREGARQKRTAIHSDVSSLGHDPLPFFEICEPRLSRFG